MWYNSIMKWLLASPVHSLVSKSMMLITYKGRKSGKTYTTPVNYIRDHNKIYVTSLRERVWWRNLRDEEMVTVRLRGVDVRAVPQVVEDDEGVADLLAVCFRLMPRLAKYYQVGLDGEGNPSTADLLETSKSKVVIKLAIDNRE